MRTSCRLCYRMREWEIDTNVLKGAKGKAWNSEVGCIAQHLHLYALTFATCPGLEIICTIGFYRGLEMQPADMNAAYLAKVYPKDAVFCL
eukprot:1141136-Pelagomonas_calceolata.AAC.2